MQISRPTNATGKGPRDGVASTAPSLSTACRDGYRAMNDRESIKVPVNRS